MASKASPPPTTRAARHRPSSPRPPLRAEPTTARAGRACRRRHRPDRRGPRGAATDHAGRAPAGERGRARGDASTPRVTLAPAGPSPEVQALLGGLTDRSPDVRWKAAESLGSLGEEAAAAVPI